MELDSMRATYTQQADSAAPINTDLNELEVEITDAGGGPYIVIKTARWALDGDKLDEFTDALRALWKQVEDAKEASRT